MAHADSFGSSIVAHGDDAIGNIVDCLKEELKKQLISVAICGGSDSETYGSRECSLLIVVQEVSTQTLDRVEAAIRRVGHRKLPLMVTTEDELQRSVDVFPIKFRDMQANHQALFGKEILDELNIATQHVRLRCEQEIKNLMLRLHQRYVLNVEFPDQLELTLRRATPRFLRDLAVMVELKTGRAVSSKQDLWDCLQKLGLDVNVLQEFAVSGPSSHTEHPMKQLYDRFMKTVHAAAVIIDELDAEMES